MLKKPIHRASFLALLIFGTLVALSWRPEKKVSDELAEGRWPVQIEFQADLSAYAQRHEVVQDTLSWHAMRLNGLGRDFRSSLEYQFCCDDPMSLADATQVLLGRLSLDFPSADLRRILLREMADAGRLELRSLIRRDGWTLGRADLQLPTPDGLGTVTLKDVGFSLQIQSAQLPHPFQS